jgi:solute carrier family 8 (sodium/calcium exchanger)
MAGSGMKGHMKLFALAVVLVTVFNVASAQENGTEAGPVGKKDKCSSTATPCRPGVIIPMWRPQGNLSGGDKAARATVYFAALIFMFLGVSIVADRFMAAIEVITSKEREVTVKKPNGETAVVSVRIWNETVSNLTLMALGSSAPEILLSVIEIIGNNFMAGDLGPSTIVGSAAFNLFIIIGICVYVIPDDEVRRIKHLGVFFITASWSIFAYLWMYVIIAVISPGIVEVWEGILTFLFFPLTVGTAYIADQKIFFYKFLSKKYRASRNKGTVVVSEGDVEMDGHPGLDSDDPEIREFERIRMDYINIMRDLRKKHPNMETKELEQMAEMAAMNKGPKSRAFYRIQATRKLTGGGNVIKKSKLNRGNSMDDMKVDLPEDDNITRIFFEPGHYTVMENVGTFQCTVTRMGGNVNNTVYVDYRTEDGTANAGSDYEYAEGTLIFHPGETHKQFSVSIIDDDVFEEDEHFYCRLSNIRVGDADGMFTSDQQECKAQLANPSMATVMILDDDHAGIFHFEQKEVTLPESIGEAQVKVQRSSGARGTVSVPYWSTEGTATGGGKDYEDISGELIFTNDQTECYIKIRIIDDEEYEKSETFYLEIGEPILVSTGLEEDEGKKVEDGEPPKTEGEDALMADLGRPRIGEITKISCHIRESMEFKGTVDKLLKKANLSLVVGTSSWREQFIEAISVSAGDGDEGEGEEQEDGTVAEPEEHLPSCMDYVMHFLSIFWKILFALVPPTDILGGWACFWASMFMIACLTAVIGDTASGFGCHIGLMDSVNAITFIALGTSLPDTFASKVAAIGDEYADSSVGNVTGSNAVNVFLGIGIAWSMAAIFHVSQGNQFEVQPGSLAFSVTIFCSFALVAVLILVLRRRPYIGGELGGPRIPKIITTCVLCSLWFFYVLLSSMENYCHIKGF